MLGVRYKYLTLAFFAEMAFVGTLQRDMARIVRLANGFKEVTSILQTD